MTTPPRTPPFRVLARRSVAHNTRFDIRFDHLRTDDGEDIPAYLVVDPLALSADGCAGVAILPVVGDRILLHHIYRHPVSRWGWEVPRGFIDDGETPLQAAQRELIEETGLHCDLDALVPLGQLSPEPGIINARVRIFAATECRDRPDHRQPELGRGEGRLFSPNEVSAMAGTETLFCAITMACFYRYREWLAA